MSAEFPSDPSEGEFFSLFEREEPFIDARMGILYLADKFADGGLERLCDQNHHEAADIVQLLFDANITLRNCAGSEYDDRANRDWLGVVSRTVDVVVQRALAGDFEYIADVTTANFAATSNAFTSRTSDIGTAYERFRRYNEISRVERGARGDSVSVNKLGMDLNYTLNRVLNPEVGGRDVEGLAIFVDQGNKNLVNGYIREAALLSNKIEPLA